MNPLEIYLKELYEIRSSGAAVKETSYYPPWRTCSTRSARPSSPRCSASSTCKNRGAGLPDGGFFTQEQFQKSADMNPCRPDPGPGGHRGQVHREMMPGSPPTGSRSPAIGANTGQVLVTNYRDFVLVGQDAAGQPVKLETYRLAPSEAAFGAAAHPRRTSHRPTANASPNTSSG